MKFATQYDFETIREGETFETINNEPSLTQQSDKDDTDINVMMKRYNATGMMPQLQTPGEYGDFSAITDYRTALEMVKQAQEKFQEIPADIRQKFGNDPQQFIDFATNPENLDEMRKMKLAPTPEPATIPAPITAPPETPKNGNTSPNISTPTNKPA